MRPWLFVLAVLLIIPLSKAELVYWDNYVNLDDKRFNVTFVYDKPIENSDYFVFALARGITVIADDKVVNCKTEDRGIGTSIICEKINASRIVYNFFYADPIQESQGLNIFRYRFAITQPVKNFSISIKLPARNILVDEARLSGTNLRPFEPTFGQVFSDGRDIFVTWYLESPPIGTRLCSSVIYESAENGISLIGFIILGVIIIAGFAIIIYIRKARFKEILPVLTENKRKVMQILINDNKPVDQRRIVKELDFSKAKVSRIIYDLEKRGLVEKRRKGRTNVLSLKRGKKVEKAIPEIKKV